MGHYSTFGELHPSQCQNKCDLMSHPAIAWANRSKLHICGPKAFWSNGMFQTRSMFLLSDLKIRPNKLGSACKCSSTRRVVYSMTVVTCLVAESTATWTISTSTSPFARCVWILLSSMLSSNMRTTFCLLELLLFILCFERHPATRVRLDTHHAFWSSEMCDIFCKWAYFVTIKQYDGIGVLALT